MNTLEIFCKLLSIKTKCTFDVLAKDQLINYNIKAPFGLCIITSPSNHAGTHWVAMFCNESRQMFFFCSFGLPIEAYGNEFLMFANLQAPNGGTISNNTQYQSFLSKRMG